MKLGVAMARARFGVAVPFPLVSGDDYPLRYDEDGGDDESRREHPRRLQGVTGGDAVRQEASRAADVSGGPRAPEIARMLAPKDEGGIRLSEENLLPDA